MSFNFACPDWAERLAKGHPLIPELPLLKDEAERAVAIFGKLRLPDVPGQPFLADAAGPWIKDIVRAIFGSVVDGRRMVREVFTLVPKKSAKTTFAAAISLTALLMNARPRADFIYAGPTQEVAARAFEQAAGMIAADEFLSVRFHVAHHLKTITDRRNKAKLKVVTFDMKVATGAKPTFVLLDELHLMGSIRDAGRVIGQLRSGMLPIPEACMVMISTQSDEAPAGVFKAELDYARAVRDGKITNGRVLPAIYEFPEDMQRDGSWRDPANWPMVLPSLGRSVSLQDILSEFEAANEKGEHEVRRWASQLLNVQIGVAMHADRWAGTDEWEAAADHDLTLESLLKRCEVACIGVDGGGLDDLLAVAVIGRDKQTKQWLLWVHAWASEKVLDRRKDIADRLRDFAFCGDLTICGAPNEDVDGFAAFVKQVMDAGLLPAERAIGFDAKGVAELVRRISEIGVAENQMVAVKQGVALNPEIEGMPRKLADGTMMHGGQPIMDWMVGNAKAVAKGSSLTIEKQTSGKAKIDGLLASFNAFHLMALNPEASGHSVYETRGILTV